MKARFIGDPANGGDGPNTIIVWGVTFEKGGEAVEVTDPRFGRHSHFEFEGGPAPKSRAARPGEQASAAQPETAGGEGA